MPSNPIEVVINPPNQPATVSSFIINAPLTVQGVNVGAQINSVQSNLNADRQFTQNQQNIIKGLATSVVVTIPTKEIGYGSAIPSNALASPVNLYTLQLTDYFIHLYSTSTHTTVVYLPRPEDTPVGKTYIIKSSAVSTADSSFRFFGQSLDGNATGYQILHPRESMQIVYIGRGYWSKINLISI